MIVQGWCNYNRVSIMGGSGVGKTYTLAHIVLLDYLANPGETTTSLTTVTADGLRLRMWGDLMRAYEAMAPEIKGAFKVFSSSNRMNIMLRDGGRDMEKYIIEGMATSRTADASGRIRGKHAPRRRVILDEADDMPPVIYETFANIMSDPDVKIVDISNATDRYSLFCKSAEPKNGWDSIVDTDLWWPTKGGICIHLDGLQNPNIKSGGKRCTFMMDMKRVEAIRNEFGESSKEWWSFVRGFPPPDGIVAKVWPSFAIEKARKVPVFDYQPEPVATLDPAYEYDDCVLILGEKGKLRDGKACIKATKSIKIKTREGQKEGIAYIPKDYQIAREVMAICKEAGVQPKNFIMDKTGNGRSVWSKLMMEWNNEIVGIEYGGSATNRPMRYGDPNKADEMVERFVSELWFRARYMAESDCLCGLSNLDAKTLDDLNARRYERKQVTKGSRMIVETKDELKKRLGRSPDYGDAYCQFAELLARDLSHTITEDKKKTANDSWTKMREKAKKIYSLQSDEAGFAKIY